MEKLKFKTVGLSIAIFLVITYILCVLFDLVFGYDMYKGWIYLFPGMKWLTFGSFLLGLVEVFIYGFYTAVIFVPIYNCLNSKYITVKEN